MLKKLSRSETQKFVLDDYFGMSEQKLTNRASVATKKLNEVYGESELTTWQKLARSINLMYPSHWIFLMLAGIFTAFVWFLIDLSSSVVLGFKYDIIENWGYTWGQNYLIWIGFTVFFALIAASAGYFNQHAEGSGIPELKSIVAGVYIYKYLSRNTLISKSIGLFGSLASGFTVGKEGPYVHLAACITNQLSKLKVFRDIQNDNILK